MQGTQLDSGLDALVVQGAADPHVGLNSVGAATRTEQRHHEVRVEGLAEPVSDAEADAYFASRERGSQIGAWASIQSRPMGDPGDLDARVAEMEQRFGSGIVPRPPHWSGFRIVADRIEFWRGMPSRLHVRHVYSRRAGGWEVTQLYP